MIALMNHRHQHGHRIRNRRRERRPGRPPSLDRLALQFLGLLSTETPASSAAVRHDLEISLSQLARVVKVARARVEPYGGEIVVERYAHGISRLGGPRWVYTYRLTVPFSALVTRMTS